MADVKEVKVTKREKFGMLLNIEEVANNEMLREFCEHEIELLDRKATSASGKTTKKNVENEAIKEKLMNYLSDGKEVRIKDVLDVEDFDDYTSSKITSLMTQLVKENKVTRRVDKKVALFKIAE